MDPASLRIVVNPSAGRHGDDAVRAELAEQLPQATLVDVDDDLIEQLERAADAPVLGIVGGDGSVNAAADVAIERGKVLLVIPGGTLNHFARDAGLDTVSDAVAALGDGSTHRVDVGRLDGRVFLNTASVGSYPELVDRRDRMEDRLATMLDRWSGRAPARLLGAASAAGKWVALAIATGVEMRRATPCELTINNNPVRAWLVFIGNCTYDPPGLAPRSREHLDDGMFDVRWVDATRRASRLRVAAAMLTGPGGSSVAVGRIVTNRVALHSWNGPLRLACDGETFDGGDAEIVVEKDPRGLSVVMAPR